MAYKNLYILGNGFDQHHDIPCGFPRFMTWVKENDAKFFMKLSKVYSNAWNSEWWMDFENNLALLNAILYASRLGNLYDPEFNTEGSIEEKTEVASLKAVEEFSAIKDSLKVDFQKWLLDAYEKCNADKMLRLQSEENIFLSFNYTKTLEEKYGIDSKHVFHIHGVIDNKDSMIVGHGKGLLELDDIIARQTPRVSGEILNKKYNLKTKLHIIPPAHIEQAAEITKEEILSLKKDVEGCIEKNKRVFDDILDVKRIIVYGFSFSPIDMPYLEKIIRRTDPQTHWIISWYSQEDQRRVMDFVIRYKIQNFTIINGIQNLDIQI